MKKPAGILILMICMMLAGCFAHHAEKEPEPEFEQKREPYPDQKSNLSSAPAMQGYERTGVDLTELDKESVPVMYEGYYLARDRDSRIRILNGNGEEVGRKRYEGMVFAGTWILTDQEGYASPFEYASCQTDDNIIEGQPQTSQEPEMEAVKDEETGLYRIVFNGEESESLYSKATPAGRRSMYARTPEGENFLFINDLNTPVILPDNAEMAAEPTPQGTILIKMEGEWTLWKGM